jgi:hypothetical protein
MFGRGGPDLAGVHALQPARGPAQHGLEAGVDHLEVGVAGDGDAEQGRVQHRLVLAAQLFRRVMSRALMTR